jgi:hypothetical protein
MITEEKMKTLCMCAMAAVFCAVPCFAFAQAASDNATVTEPANQSGEGLSSGCANESAGQNATQGMNVSLGANTSAAMGGGNESQNATGTAYSMGVNKNETGQGGVSNESNQTGMGLDAGLAEGATGSYTYEQKDKMNADVKDQIKELDLRIDTAKRQGDNSAARLLQQDREKLKKQLGEVKKANRDNWDRVQNSTMDMMNQMNLTK